MKLTDESLRFLIKASNNLIDDAVRIRWFLNDLQLPELSFEDVITDFNNSVVEVKTLIGGLEDGN